MASTPAQLQRALTPSTSGHDLRAFYQGRLSLVFFVMGGISLVFFLLHNTLEVLSGNLTFGQVFTLPLNHWHMSGALLAESLGAALRFGAPSTAWLGVIDAGGCLAVLGCYDMMAFTLLGVPAPRFDLVITMVYVLFQMTRAVIVPSTVRRTILVCSLCALPLLLMTWLLARHAPDAWTADRIVYAPLYTALWCLDSAIPAALASSVIYGLRQQVREAKQLGPYTLEEKLGEGGMGSVYRARHALLRRPTAVKLLRADRTGEAALLRFEREVQLTSQLSHPNTVSIYDYGRTADGIFYYAMEYLDGLDLQRLVELAGAQPPARVVHILSQVCRALSEAHGLGSIHRDIKPANIILCEHGGAQDVVKVVDFGLVKSLGNSDDAQLSMAEAIVGTPHCLAPEAIRSSEADLRSDLYALGAVGYFLLAGKHMFEGESAMEVCAHQLHTTPPALPEHVPTALAEVLMRCLSKDPDARPQSATELLHALAALDIPAWTELQARSWWLQRDRDANTHAQAATAPTLLDLKVAVQARD
jgi:eukaryotic-like serine/threonine-protein kinase